MISKAVKQTGDTLVEVMISIAVVALAIAISYAISGKNLNVGITARERTSAVGLVQGQIERMNEVQQADPPTLIGLRTTPHFCFSNTNTPVTNPTVNFNNDNLTGGNSYAPTCVDPSGRYFLDVSFVPLSGIGATASGNSFKFTARWYRAGGGANQIVTVYYRPW